jgi:hypothetical protein
MMTAFPGVESAVEAMTLGAFHYRDEASEPG